MINSSYFVKPALAIVPEEEPIVAPSGTLNIGEQANYADFFKFPNICNLVSVVANTLFIFGIIAFFVILVMGGLQWMTAGGDKNKVSEAQKRLTSGLIGLILMAASYAIYIFVLNFLGINISIFCANLDLPI